jgi:hypothetical protein
MTHIQDGTEWLDDQERSVYLAVGELNRASRTTNNSQVATAAGISRTAVTGVCHHLKARGFLRDASKGAAYHWRTTDKPVHFWRDRGSLKEFMARFAPGGQRVVAEIKPDRDERGDSPFIVIRDGDRTAVICVMSLDNHLCIDVHPFIGGQAATASVFGIADGHDVQLPATGTTSHGKPSVGLASVLIGEQGK